MKKLITIILAVILAFVLAMGDQINFKLDKIKNLLKVPNKEKNIELVEKTEEKKLPKLAQLKNKEVKEENLTYIQRIEKGDYYYKKGFLRFAINEYLKAAKINPNNTDIYLKISKAYYDLMDFEKANKNAEKVLSISPSNYDANLAIVKIDIKQSKFKEALAKIDSLLIDNPKDYILLYYKGILKIAFNKHEEAKKLLQESLENSNSDYEIDNKIQIIFEAYDEFNFAKEAEDLYLSELLSKSFNQIEEYELAIYKLKQILKNRGDLRDAWLLLGFAYLNNGNYLFSSTSFEKAYEIDPSWSPTQYFLGLSYYEMERNEDAIIYLNYAIQNGFKPELLVWQRLAELYLNVKDFEKSIEAYKKVLEINNKDINAFVRPIWIYMDFLNKPEEALKLGETAVIHFPNNAMAYNLLGWSQIGVKNYKEAEINLKKSIAMDSGIAATYYNIAKLYTEENKIELALKNYQKAYELDQNGSIGNLSAKQYNLLIKKEK